MKRFGYVILLGLVLAICLGLTACGKEGGTLEVLNNSLTSCYVTIHFDQVEVFSGDIQSWKSVKRSKDKDFEYRVIFKADASSSSSTTVFGSVGGGETVVEKRFYFDEF